MIIIGVDNGNANTKTITENFVSGLTRHDVRPPMAQDLLLYDGAYYTLSHKRNTYQRDKTTTKSAYILTLFAIAKELLSRGLYGTDEEIILGVGLPPGHFGTGHRKFMEYFLQNDGRVEFTYNDKKFSVKIAKVYVYPQAYAAVASRPSNLKKYSSTYIIDIGGYTTDVLLLANGKADLSVNYSFNLGIITMNNRIKNRVNTAFDATIEENHIYDVLFDRPNVLSDEIKSFIKEESKKHAEHILDKLREEGIDLKATPAIFIGGGSLLLRPFLENSNKVAEAEFIEEVEANAIGYEALMKVSVARKKK